MDPGAEPSEAFEMGRVPKDQFFQFSWRPRAPSLLSKEAEADIGRRLKEFSKRYDEEDSDILKQARPPCVASRFSPLPLHTLLRRERTCMRG